MNSKSSSVQSDWRAPELSLRFWPVFLRNLLVWRKLAIPSLVGNIAEPLMWLVAFGYGMGALVGKITVQTPDGAVAVPYILFLASGSICMSAMQAASFEALYSAFSRMHVQKTWDGILNAPVGLDDIVLAEMLWAAFKALFTVTAIIGVMLALGITHSPKILLAWPILLGVGITFSCMALVFNALAKGYDFFTYYFTLFLTPVMFLSGVFFRWSSCQRTCAWSPTGCPWPAPWPWCVRCSWTSGRRMRRAICWCWRPMLACRSGSRWR